MLAMQTRALAILLAILVAAAPLVGWRPCALHVAQCGGSATPASALVMVTAADAGAAVSASQSACPLCGPGDARAAAADRPTCARAEDGSVPAPDEGGGCCGTSQSCRCGTAHALVAPALVECLGLAPQACGARTDAALHAASRSLETPTPPPNRA